MAPRRTYAALCAILLWHVVLSTAFSLATPVWDAYDETGHYAYARYIAVNNRLPPPQERLKVAYDESHQPPLYYWLVAVPIRWVDVADDLQPVLTFGFPRVIAPKEDTWPYTGTVLAIRLARLASVAFSVLGPLFTFLAVKVALPRADKAALAAAFLHGTWPLYAFQSGTITNDIGVAVSASITFWAVARLWFRPKSELVVNTLVSLLAGSACVLMKDNGLALHLFALVNIALALAVRLRRNLVYAGLIAALSALLAGGLQLASYELSGGRTSRAVMTVGQSLTSKLTRLPDMPRAGASDADPQNALLAERAGPSEPLEPQSPARILVRSIESLFGYGSFRVMFAAYSWGMLGLPDLWYMAARAAILLALAGLLLAIRSRPPLFFCALCVLLGVAVVAPPIWRDAAYRINGPDLYIGRFFLPALSGFTSLLAVALLSWPKRFRAPVGAIALGVVGLISAASPWLVIEAAHRPANDLSDDDARTSAQTFQPVRYGDEIELVGFSHPQGHTRAGEYGQIRLFWRVNRSIKNPNWTMQLDLFGLQGRSFEARQTMALSPGEFPVTEWRPGGTFAHTYTFMVPKDAPVPTLAGVRVAWVNWATGQTLAKTCGGQPCDPIIGSLAVGLSEEDRRRLDQSPTLQVFDSKIELRGVSYPSSIALGDHLAVRPVWKSIAPDLKDFVVFIHVFDEQGKMVAQHDTPPLSGLFPSSRWQLGEIVPDVITVQSVAQLPAGKYFLRMGVYDAVTKARLSAVDGAGKAAPDAVALLGSFEIR